MPLIRSIKVILFAILFSNIVHAAGFLGVNLEDRGGQVVLKMVSKNSPAENGGLMADDIITHLAGEKVADMKSLLTALQKTKAGDKVEFTIIRNNIVKNATVTLGERPKAAKKKAKREGLINAPAPAINQIKKWHNLPEGKKTIDLADFKGKTVYLYCFQSWCPGCHSAGFPTMKKLIEHYKGDKSVVFLTVQTVFEGYTTNTFENGKSVLKKFGLTIPMGHDGTKLKRSEIMHKYNTGGTPWTIVIDPEGTIRYSTFHIQPKQAIQLIDGFKKKKK